jgi:hypothetical protein
MAGRGSATALATALCLLSACRDEPDFDERYHAAEEKIREKAKDIDNAIAKTQREKVGEKAPGVSEPATDETGRGPAT